MCVQRQDVGSDWDCILMDGSLLVLCLLCSQPASGSVCNERRTLAIALRLIWSQIRVFKLVSKSLRKTLAVILRTDVGSVPSGGFNNRWRLAV